MPLRHATPNKLNGVWRWTQDYQKHYVPTENGERVRKMERTRKNKHHRVWWMLMINKKYSIVRFRACRKTLPQLNCTQSLFWYSWMSYIFSSNVLKLIVLIWRSCRRNKKHIKWVNRSSVMCVSRDLSKPLSLPNKNVYSHTSSAIFDDDFYRIIFILSYSDIIRLGFGRHYYQNTDFFLSF